MDKISRTGYLDVHLYHDLIKRAECWGQERYNAKLRLTGIGVAEGGSNSLLSRLMTMSDGQNKQKKNAHA